MEKKILQVYNPNNLPTLPYTQLMDFQGDLKHPIEPDALEKMRGSLKKHGVFVPKFVWFDDAGNANILDGHQTKQGLASLEAEGWTIPPIPYVKVDASNREDAAEKLLQINSEYAKINPNTTWFESFNFPDISEILGSVEIPELSVVFSDLNFFDIPGKEYKEQPPDDFREYGDDIETQYRCPKCSYEWSGKPK